MSEYVDCKPSDFSARKIPPKKPDLAQQQGQGYSNDLTPDPVTNVNTATRAAKPFIIIEFYNFWVRRQVYAAKRQLKYTGIFISEQLPHEMNALFFKCRQLKKNNRIKASWTYALTICIKTNQGQNIKIFSEADLSQFEAVTRNEITGPTSIPDSAAVNTSIQ